MDKAILRSTSIHVFNRDNGLCCFCGREIDRFRDEWDLHHVLPKKRGGSDHAENLAPAHLECHRKHHTRIHKKAEVNKKRLTKRDKKKANRNFLHGITATRLAELQGNGGS